MKRSKLDRIINESVKSAINEWTGYTSNDIYRIENDFRYWGIKNVSIDKRRSTKNYIYVIFTDNIDERMFDRYVARINTIVQKYGFQQCGRRKSRPDDDGNFEYELSYQRKQEKFQPLMYH